MSTQTTNLNLSKAENTDEILSTLSANNDNWDTIDSAIYTNQQNISGKQATLVSGTNIKTINNESLLGSGNITISGGGSSGVTILEPTEENPLDFNTLTDSGLYIIKYSTSSSVSHSPTTTTPIEMIARVCKSGSGFIFQIIDCNSTSSSPSSPASRYYNPSNSTWSGWDNKISAANVGSGYLGGTVYANATSVTNLTNKQIRNIYANTTAMTSGTTSLTTGDIYLQYE